mgnify:FL=1
MDWTAQYAVGNQFTGETGYVKNGPCSGFNGMAIMIHFDTKANAEAAWTARSGTLCNHAAENTDFHCATVDGVEVFFCWASPAGHCRH